MKLLRILLIIGLIFAQSNARADQFPLNVLGRLCASAAIHLALISGVYISLPEQQKNRLVAYVDYGSTYFYDGLGKTGKKQVGAISRRDLPVRESGIKAMFSLASLYLLYFGYKLHQNRQRKF